MFGAGRALGRRLGAFRIPFSVGARWAASFSVWLTLGFVLAAWIGKDIPLREELFGLPEKFAMGFAVMFGVWLLIRVLSTVCVHEAGILAPSTFGPRVAILWEEIGSIRTVSTNGLSAIELHRDGKLNGFISVEIFNSREFQRLVRTTAGAACPVFKSELDFS